MSIQEPANPREAKVKEIYNRLLGRDPDESGWQTYVFDSNVSTDTIEATIRASNEYYKRFNAPKYNVGIGRDAGNLRQDQYYDPADYIESLKMGGEGNLKRTRNEVLDWLRDAATGQRWLRDEQRAGATNPDMPGGISLFDRIEGAGAPNRDINPGWGDYAANTEAGQYFGHADLLATRALNFQDVEIRSVLDQNMGWLRDANLPLSQGGSPTGVYESLQLTGVDAPPHDTKKPGSPTVTRNPSQYDVDIERTVIGQPDRDSLKINPGQALTTKAARGIKAKRPRKKYKQTTDLSRESRNLNIS